MGDLTELESSQSVKLAGALADGTETVFIDFEIVDGKPRVPIRDSIHGKSFSTDPNGVILPIAIDNQIDFLFPMKDIELVNDEDITIKFGSAPGSPSSMVLELPAGVHSISDQNSRYMFVTTTTATRIDMFANGGAE